MEGEFIMTLEELLAILLFMLITGLGLFLVYRGMQDPKVRTQYKSLSWNRTTAKVLECAITDRGDYQENRFNLLVEYEYVIDSIRYKGKDHILSSSKPKFQKGSSIRVRYNPSLPIESRIWFNWNFAMVPGCGIIIALSGVGAIVSCLLITL